MLILLTLAVNRSICIYGHCRDSASDMPVVVSDFNEWFLLCAFRRLTAVGHFKTDVGIRVIFSLMDPFGFSR